MHKKHIFVGMSGGVDSSVAALLLKTQGHQVEGVFMKNWEEESEQCSASTDLADAQAVCDQLQVPLHSINFAQDYWEKVFSHFLTEFKKGRTPNPDILCNKEIKFKAFLQFARQRGADLIATGHYARVAEVAPYAEYHLLKGSDPQKDQSYFLHALDQQQLAHALFPLGEMTKTTVREIAKQAGFKNHAKKDSTGICFIGERKFKLFLNDFLPAQPGPIQTLTGQTIGQHDGLMFYTLGQRQGLKIGGQKNGLAAPWYVVQKNMAQNSLIVAQGEEGPELYSTTVFTQSIHWISERPRQFPLTVSAKTRYRQPDQTCIIHEDKTTDHYRVEFAEPQRAVTPGQYIVFYQNTTCLGGGVIADRDHLSPLPTVHAKKL